MNKMIEGKDFEYIPHPQDYTGPAHVKLLRRAYKGVIIQYGRLKLSELPNGDGTINANFNFDFIDTNGKSPALFETAEFNNYLGDILFSILEENMNQLQEINTKEMLDDFRENVIEEPDLERGVRTKSSTIRKR